MLLGVSLPPPGALPGDTGRVSTLGLYSYRVSTRRHRRRCHAQHAPMHPADEREVSGAGRAGPVQLRRLHRDPSTEGARPGKNLSAISVRPSSGVNVQSIIPSTVISRTIASS